MARPERNTVDYFPHLLGEGKKMYFIENKYGNNGYATWYKILEKLGSSEYHYLNLNREDELMFLAAKCKVSEELLISIINDLVKMEVFSKELWANKIIWCPQFMESIEDAYKKRNNKCITLDGLRLLLTSLGILKPSKCTIKGDVKPQRIEEDSKEEDSKVNYRSFAHLKLSFLEFDKLKAAGYSQIQIDNILNQIENYAKNKNYKNLYLTAINWLNKETQTKPISKIEKGLNDIEEGKNIIKSIIHGNS
jgi:hypothetical protein